MVRLSLILPLHQLKEVITGVLAAPPTTNTGISKMAENPDFFVEEGETREGLALKGTHEHRPVGQFYIIFSIIWTLFICGSLIWLYSLRNSVAVRIRNFWLVASAVLVLNIYEITVFMRFPLGDLFTCSAEYWIMSIILPLGIALFQGV